MAQGYDKYELDNQTGQSFRFALNDILEAAATQNSGDNSPNTTNTSYPYQTWVDTTNDIVKIRDAATASSWYSLYSVDSDGKPTGAVSYGSYTIATNDTAGTGGTAAITVDTSQNVGIGTTGPSSKLHSVGTTILGTGTYPTGSIGLSDARTAILSSTENQILVIGNTNATVGVDKGAEIYLGAKATTGSENLAFAKVGGFRSTATSGNFASHLTFSTSNSVGTSSEKVRVDSGGRVLIGTTDTYSASHYYDDLVIHNDGASTGAGITVLGNASYGYAGIVFADSVDAVNGGAIKYYNNQDYMWFETVGTERMRLDNYGYLQTFGTYNAAALRVSVGAGTTNAALFICHSATAVNNGTVSMQVWSNGNVQNTNNSYGAISDIKLKENIVNANSQWDDLKAIQVRNYNFKEGQTHTQLGVVAQEVELVSPGLVYESPDRDEEGNDLGTVTKSVNYSVLYMKAVKALQEAMERIETLEAKVAALESA